MFDLFHVVLVLSLNLVWSRNWEIEGNYQSQVPSVLIFK